MDRKQGKEDLNLKADFMKVILLMVNFTDTENITLDNQVKYMKVTSLTITWKAKA